MWHVTVQSYHPSLGDECITFNTYVFNTDLEAWRFHELVFKAVNTMAVSKPIDVTKVLR